MAEPTPTPTPTKQKRPFGRSVLILLAIFAGVVVYAYGFSVTDVDLSQIRSETRREQLTRVMRALARPELVTYERIETNTDVPFYMPCPAGGFTPPEVDPFSRHITVDPACTEPGGSITVHGEHFSPNARVTIYLVPPSNDLELTLKSGVIADDSGSFTVTVDTRERPSDRQQTIRVKTREPIGSIFAPVTVESIDPNTGASVVVKSPRISQAALDTWDKIIETVFLALLATTLGVLIAVPMSFLAARNLMKDITTPLIKLGLQLVAAPVGVVVGVVAARWAQDLSGLLTGSTLLVLLGLLILPGLIVLALRWSFPAVELDSPTVGVRIARGVVLFVAAVASIVVLFLSASLLQRFGTWVAPKLGSFEFLGAFSTTVGDILAAIITVLSALAGAGVLVNLAGKLSSWMRNHLPDAITRPLAVPLVGLAFALVAVIIGQGLDWLYQIGDPVKIIWVPAAIGAAFGMFLAIRAYKREVVNIGLTVYYMARTTFNGIRSIEPLVMVIVFVVWVGIGPFAGSLALALHTIASLSKLYSEQVESILPGPVEAVQATGATRLQTVVYAVIPQIVPPYISFTLYRWDINVRMSTIIGFAGGGGIGFLLQQNIRLLNYQAASVNMLAIAIVVASMDYLSSKIRERIV